MNKIYLLAAVLFTGYVSAQQALPFTDNFNYSAGTNLHIQSPWSVLGIASSTGDHIVCDGNQALIEAGGTDAQVTIAPQNSGSVFYALELTVTGALSAAIDANGGYLAGFISNTSTHGSTLWVKKDPADATNTKFAIGVEVLSATGASTSFTTYKYNLNTKYKVVVSYNFNGGASDDVVKLWVDPLATDENVPLITDTHTGTDFSSIVSFFLRQDSVAETPALTIDNLKISNTFTSVLATEKFDAIAGLRVSPNPTSTELNIVSDSFASKVVEMYDMLGKVVLKATVNNQALNVSSLAKGVYVARITEEGKVATRRIVIE